MPKNKNRTKDSKDFASKRTPNPPEGREGRGEPPGVTEEQPAPREVGQYTGRGTPALTKK
ncbi:MAG: hypothetical protein ACRDJN_12745 [Chloroflexota bacterium]